MSLKDDMEVGVKEEDEEEEEADEEEEEEEEGEEANMGLLNEGQERGTRVPTFGFL